MIKAPLSEQIIVAVSRLVDDAQTGARDPSHSDIEFQIDHVGLVDGDPKRQGQVVGKAKRVRATLYWALEHNLDAGEALVANLVAAIRGCGGFRADSPNFVGADAVADAKNAFRSEGFELSSDGELCPLVLDGLSGTELTDVLQSYVRRARKGATDAALVTGTGKDLLEAVAAHVLTEKWGSYPQQANFPALLGQAFVTVDLATPQDTKVPSEPAQKDVERAMYELGCSLNRLRNKEGTGHGRPWLPSVTDDEARVAIEGMGLIADRLLAALKHGK
jgi:hypothetical protein